MDDGPLPGCGIIPAAPPAIGFLRRSATISGPIGDFPPSIALSPRGFYDPCTNAGKSIGPRAAKTGGDLRCRCCRLLAPDGARRERHAGAAAQASQGTARAGVGPVWRPA